MTADTVPAIDVRAVTKQFGSLQALKGVDLQVERGEFFGLLGPNGAGKSTLIGIISGLVRASGGSVSVMGHDVSRDFRHARRALGVVPQELVFDPFFKVIDTLRLQAGYYGCGREARPWIDELLERLELTDKRNATMRGLSGGMKRRVLIAQALVHRPPVVVLDEPTAGVDVELRRTLWTFARELHAAGHTIVLTTHYLEEAEDLCSRVAIVDRGAVRVVSTTRDLLARHPFRFLRVTLSGAGLPAHLQSQAEACADDTWELKLDRKTQPIGNVIEELRQAGCRLEDIATREPSLEDVFVELTDKESQPDAA
ncbi:ABC transporter ATP-binding protein [Algiphilus sp. NNCM1]|nr:ABC transporter ATP-binding protein [Algiphilus sp.]MBY8966185.1 ABC transporter ATP-binding protein [Algiphilus acroporae]MCI5103864.1 ABC transporter ATP-binding protein [Algiphilus sp.]